jgi:hypothetical protein
MRVELLLAISLQILSFNAMIAFLAHRIVELVVVLRAVRSVVHDVELGSHKRRLACFADEAFFVEATCEPTICCFDGLAIDVGATASALAFADGRLEAWRWVGVDIRS